MSNLYALLIGIDFYFPNLLPGGGSYPSLGGCVRDVRHVEEYFKTRLETAAFAHPETHRHEHGRQQTCRTSRPTADLREHGRQVQRTDRHGKVG